METKCPLSLILRLQNIPCPYNRSGTYIAQQGIVYNELNKRCLAVKFLTYFDYFFTVISKCRKY